MRDSNNSWLNGNSCLLLCLLILAPVDVMAVHDLILFDREENWITEDFDIHAKESLQQLGKDTSPFFYRNQLSISHSGEGFEDKELLDYSQVRFFHSHLHFTGLYDVSPGWEIYAGAELSLEREAGEESTRETDIESLYVLREFRSSSAWMGFGRQEVSDDREWLLDTRIDGLSLVWLSEKNAFSAIVGTEATTLEELFGSSAHSEDEGGYDFIFYSRLYRALTDNVQASAYLTYLRDSESSEVKQYLGIRSLGYVAEDLYYWSEAVILDGKEDSRAINAWAIDVGANYTRSNSMLQPNFTVAYAIGSGDDGLNGDSRFRQTGLHANDIYGEVLAPELSNLQIATIGAGISPNDNVSINLLYHRYWQVNPSIDFFSDGIEISPDGENHSLGHGLDFIFDLGDISALSFEFSYGRYWGDDGITADVGSLEFIWNF